MGSTNASSNDNRSLEDIIIEIDRRPQSSDPPSSGTIFRVPPNLRKVDEDAFMPKVVSLGPYHRTDTSLQEMQEQKARCLHKFLQEIAKPQASSGLSEKLNHCMNEMRKMEPNTRVFYSGVSDMVGDEFSKMMLLDGCFILDILRYRSRVADTPCMYSLVAMDMLMLENQIPLPILEKLYELVPPDAQGNKISLDMHILTYAKFFHLDLEGPPTSDSTHHHLLHKIHSWMVPSKAPHPEELNQNQRYHRVQGRVKETVKESTPSAVHLRDAGIKIREKVKGAMLELSYRDGVLEMSQLKIYDDFRFLFRNLIAFEHGYLKAGRYVTDYTFFVDKLINTSWDVALLHDKGVVLNGLGSDEEAAQLINSLTKNMIWDSDTNELKVVFEGINERYRRKTSKWWAKLKMEHCGSPWLIISVMAASAALVFTGTQTVYSVLSYYNKH